MFLPPAFEISLIVETSFSRLSIEIRLKIWILNVLTLKMTRNISVVLLWINYWHF